MSWAGAGGPVAIQHPMFSTMAEPPPCQPQTGPKTCCVRSLAILGFILLVAAVTYGALGMLLIALFS
jgi:hypothetical protein